MATKIIEMSLSEVSSSIANRTVSSVDVVDACLTQLEATEADLNAFISVFWDRARDEASKCDSAVIKGRPAGPLHGVPLSIKDNIPVKGQTTTVGSALYKDWVPKADAKSVQKLRQSGAVLIGKTNLHEFAWGGTSENPHFGRVGNPWGTDRMAGGSSGGSAASVASRSCFGSVGTDTGGSIRVPAALCGVVGLRPTFRAVSTEGVFPLAWSMDTVGPLSRTVTDCASLFSVLAGRSTGMPADDVVTRGLKLGFIPNGTFGGSQLAIERALQRMVGSLSEIGMSSTEIPAQKLLPVVRAALVVVESAEPSSYHQRWLRDYPDYYGQDVRALLEVGSFLSAVEYLDAQRFRAMLRSELENIFDKIDVLICPTVPFTAPRAGSSTIEVQRGDREDLWMNMLKYTGISSLSGYPSLSLPAGFDTGGMPIGIQLIGRPDEENNLFSVGKAYEAISGLHRYVPGMER